MLKQSSSSTFHLDPSSHQNKHPGLRLTRSNGEVLSSGDLAADWKLWRFLRGKQRKIMNLLQPLKICRISVEWFDVFHVSNFGCESVGWIWDLNSQHVNGCLLYLLQTGIYEGSNRAEQSPMPDMFQTHDSEDSSPKLYQIVSLDPGTLIRHVRKQNDKCLQQPASYSVRCLFYQVQSTEQRHCLRHSFNKTWIYI